MKRTVSLVIALVLGSAIYLLGWSNLFQVKKITINEKDKGIVAELDARLNQSPIVVRIGQPMARVDKKEIGNRLRTLIWVDQVDVRRDFFSGEIKISARPREAIAQVLGSVERPSNQMAFLGSDLQLFYVSQDEVEKAAKAGDVDWLSLPTLTLGSADPQLRSDIETLMREIVSFGGTVRSIRAEDGENISAEITKDGRSLDISWGSVKELPLKFQVLERLLALKANKNVKRIDITSPLSPIVASN